MSVVLIKHDTLVSYLPNRVEHRTVFKLFSVRYSCKETFKNFSQRSFADKASSINFYGDGMAIKLKISIRLISMISW